MGVKCTNCGNNDFKNKFENRQVKIQAVVSTDEEPVKVDSIFNCVCAKCIRCNKILFTKMSTYRKLKKDAENYFRQSYNSEKVELKKIDL